MTLRWLDIDADATVQNKGSLLFLLDQRRRRFLFFSHRVERGEHLYLAGYAYPCVICVLGF